MWGMYERAALSPAMAAALWEAITNSDVRAVVPTIDVPTLVLAHRDSAIPVEHARYLASHIDGARLVELPGRDHAPHGGDIKGVADEMEEFLTGARHPSSTDRVLATVMLTDIVGSTERAAAIGDTAWKTVRERHDALVRRQLPRFGGRDLKQTGDGFLAVFDGPARAVDCAEAVREAIRELDLTLRIGIHTGECELIGDDITGMAVNIAARIGELVDRRRCWYRALCATWSSGRISGSSTPESTRSRAFQASGACFGSQTQPVAALHSSISGSTRLRPIASLAARLGAPQDCSVDWYD